MHAVHEQVASHFPSPLNYQIDTDNAASEPPIRGHYLPPISSVSVKVLPEVGALSGENPQTFWVAVEVEGVLYNRRASVDYGLDIIVLVDNG